MRAQFPITQFLVINYPHSSNTDIHLLRQYSSQYDMVSLLTKLFTLSMRTTVMTVFACPGFGSSTELSRPARKQALHFFTDLSHKSYCVYGHHLATNRGQFNLFSCQKLDNVSLLLSHQILQHEHHPVLIPRQLDGILYQSLFSLFCVCGCSCILESTLKISIEFLYVWLRSPLAALANMQMVTMLRRFVSFYLNTLCLIKSMDSTDALIFPSRLIAN